MIKFGNQMYGPYWLGVPGGYTGQRRSMLRPEAVVQHLKPKVHKNRRSMLRQLREAEELLSKNSADMRTLSVEAAKIEARRKEAAKVEDVIKRANALACAEGDLYSLEFERDAIRQRGRQLRGVAESIRQKMKDPLLVECEGLIEQAERMRDELGKLIDERQRILDFYTTALLVPKKEEAARDRLIDELKLGKYWDMIDHELQEDGRPAITRRALNLVGIKLPTDDVKRKRGEEITIEI